MVREILGPDTELTVLMGAGVDPHLYKPIASDITALQNADVIIYSGLHLEGRMEELMERMRKSGKIVHAVSDAVPPGELLGGSDDHHDPHVWGDASLWARCVPQVAQVLAKALPERAEAIREAAERYEKELLVLHDWAKQRMDSIPQSQRVLITSHDAFGYFGRAYGFEVVGVQGLSTATEAGLADITAVIDLIRSRGLRAIFVETSVSPGTIERISSDTGAVIGGELFSDALGTPGEMETVDGETYDKGTYIGMLKHNINTIVQALTP